MEHPMRLDVVTDWSSGTTVMDRPVRVLVADTDPDTADSLGWLFELYGCRVCVAHDGSATEADAERFHPHLILTDLDSRHGFEGVHRIRSHRWGSDIRIVAHSGWSTEEVQERARAAGCDDYLIKPVAPEVFRELIDAVAARPAGV